MAFREEIKLIVDLVTGGTTSSLKQLRTDLDNTDGSFNKLKVAGAGAFDMIKQNAVMFGAAAATAVAGFTIKAVGDFQEVALGAGELRDALGVTAEEASKLQELAGDLGVGTDTLASALGRMNKTAGESPEKFDEIGASIKRNADGTMDVSATFLAVSEAIDKIPDAGKRAEAGARIFGRGWQGISEIIMQGADGIRESLDSIETSKIMSDDIARARKFRDTMDELKGVFESVAITVGEAVVPIVTDVATGVIKVKDALEDLKNAIPGGGGFWDWLDTTGSEFWRIGPEKVVELKNQIEDLGEKSVTASVALGDLHSTLFITGGEFEHTAGVSQALIEKLADMDLTVRGTRGELEDTKTAAELFADSLDRIDREYAEMAGTINRDKSLFDLENQFGEVMTAGVEAFAANEAGAEDAAAKTREHKGAVLDLKGQIVAYADELGNIPPNVVSDILAQVDRGQLDAAMQSVRNLDGSTATIYLSADASRFNATVTNALGRAVIPIRGVNAAEAGGTSYGPGGAILVGEEGPEIVELPAGHRTIPANETARILNASGGGSGTPVGGTTNYITIHTGADPRAVVRAIKDYERDNGKGWRAS
jgi:methyl-accepting chemotaxis protein